MSKEEARQAVVSEYDSWAKKHPAQASDWPLVASRTEIEQVRPNAMASFFIFFSSHISLILPL
jgi:hypothetical protein